MAQADWTLANNSLSSGSVRRGITHGIPRPAGGGDFLYGFNSVDASVGAVTLYSNLADFAPTTKGASVRGALKRGLGGGNTNFSVFLYVCAQGGDVGDNAYLLGISDENPGRIVLRKGKLSDGIPAAAPGSLGVIARSTADFPPDTWLHLRLDSIKNDNGDVVLNVFRNDLALQDVNSPIWTPVPGITNVFVDDALGINTGTTPYTSGRVGFGFSTQDVTRRAYVDHVQVLRQSL